MKRLFIAIELSDAVRASLADVRPHPARLCEGVRWVKPELMHLTLRFIGNVADGDVAEVCDAVECAARGCDPFEFGVRGGGCFPGRGPVRMLWVGVDEPTGALDRCVDAVARAMESLGLEPDRLGFTAHLTIGRVREDRTNGALRTAVERLEVDEQRMQVAFIAVIASVLTPQGPVYTTVRRARLGGISSTHKATTPEKG